MKIRVWDGTPSTTEIMVRLIQISDSEIMLAAVDEFGNCLADSRSDIHGGALLTLDISGEVSLSTAVMPSLGFLLDVDGRLRLSALSERMMAIRAQQYGGKRTSFRIIK